MFSRAKSVVGRAVMLVGTSNRLRPYFPLMIRIIVVGVFIVVNTCVSAICSVAV